jgi:hypothetical protein
VNRIRVAIRRFRWRLLLAAPILLAIAVSINWFPLYLVFIADVCLVVSAFGRRRPRQLPR